MYSQSYLVDRMMQLHSYQPCPEDYCTNIQYNPQDEMLQMLLLIGWHNLWRVKSGSLDYPFLGSGIAVHDRYYIARLFFLWEIYTYGIFSIYYFYLCLFFILCFWHLHYMIFAFQQNMAFWTFLPVKQIWIVFTWTLFILF